MCNTFVFLRLIILVVAVLMPSLSAVEYQPLSELRLINQNGLTNSHLCTYRFHKPYPAALFKLISGWSCYKYAHPKWMANHTVVRSHQGILQNLIEYPIPFIRVNNTNVLFDYEDSNYTDIIKSLHLDLKYYQKWYNCARSAMDCCWTHLNDENQQSNVNFPCPALWDGYTCYEKTKANTDVKKPCPSYLTSNDKFICDLQSSKQCLASGWNHTTDYLSCSSSLRYRDQHSFHIIIIAIASVIMLPSLIIFFWYDKLRKWRFALHRNLILAIFIKNLLVLISKNVIILDVINVEHGESLMENDNNWCRMLVFFENLSKNLIFTCMTADAFHTHKTIVRAFSSELNVHITYAVIGVSSLLPTIVWSVFMGVNETGHCWIADDKGYQWITDGYKYFCLVLNVIFLCDIVRVLVLKLGKNTDRKHPGRAIKVTLVLVFLFGVPLLISSQRDLVNMNNCLAADIYVYATYSIEALQGVYLSLFFCYMNQNVIKELMGSWRNINVKYQARRTVVQETIKRRKSHMTNLTHVFSSE